MKKTSAAAAALISKIAALQERATVAKKQAKLAKQAKRAQQKASAGPSILASPKLWGTLIVVIVAVGRIVVGPRGQTGPRLR